MAPSFMKSFKVLALGALLTLAATLSCGSPTNITQATDGSTDGFIKVIKRNTQAKDLLATAYITPIRDAAVAASHGKNEEFTKNMIAGMFDNNRNYNYVICVDSSPGTLFTGTEGVDWAQDWIVGVTNVNFWHLFVGGSGTFIRKGKGGYKNWAWKGSVKKGQDMKSNVINFVKPGGMDSDIGSGGD